MSTDTAPADRSWDPPTIVAEKPVNSALCFTAGLAVLLLNRARYALLGYRNARPFSISDIEQAIAYDFRVVEQWSNWLRIYTGDRVQISGKNVLELGPGADLGVGLTLLGFGASSYNALDVNDLVSNVPPAFYEALFTALQRRGLDDGIISNLREQLQQTQARKNDRLNYIVNDDFDIGVFAERDIDLVVSQAAFEHFDDVDDTLRLLSRHVKPGCVLVAEVDLSAHTRWFRDHDPLNIYRYRAGLYNALRFRGAPNRVPASEYAAILRDAGWSDIVTVPLRKVSPTYLEAITPALPRKRAQIEDEAGFLSICLCATKGPAS